MQDEHSAISCRKKSKLLESNRKRTNNFRVSLSTCLIIEVCENIGICRYCRIIVSKKESSRRQLVSKTLLVIKLSSCNFVHLSTNVVIILLKTFFIIHINILTKHNFRSDQKKIYRNKN
ncbi:hypothetical protein FGO68_gene4988 [Halteria grandinella]|uniref:Uncharacterized protein n=1 Tax=Halteria grandinella TaxID=5974 RepID=A0A8J8T4P1_HALGN|nr:hypothetical protein FGO68_gene4988 [Halteria grandinella]